MTEEDTHGDDFLSFSQESCEDGNRSRQFHRFQRGNKHNNRQRFGFGYNQQQPYNHHNRSQHNRSYRQQSDNSFNNGGQKRGEYSIQDYIHPSMWEDPWEHCRRKNPIESCTTENISEKDTQANENTPSPSEEKT